MREEAVVVVQLSGVVWYVSIIQWDVVTKFRGESVTGDGLRHGKEKMVDPTESLSMVSGR